MHETEKLNNLINRFFREEDRQNPTGATSMGIHKYDTELEDLSESGIGEAKKLMSRTEQELADLNFDALDNDGKIKYHLLLEKTRAYHRAFDIQRSPERFPTLYGTVALQSIFLLLLRDSTPLEHRLKSAAARMKKIPDLFEQARKNLDNPPEIYTKIALSMVRGGASSIDTLLEKILENEPALRGEVSSSWKSARKSFENYITFLENDLLPRSRGEFAVGREFLDSLLKDGEFLDLDSDALFEIGTRELEQCRQELVEFTRKAYDTDRPWQDVFEDMKKNHPSREEILHVYTISMERAKDFVRDHDIVTIPENEWIEVMETPEFNRSTTPHVALMPPALFDENRKSFFWVTPPDSAMSPEDQEKHLQESAYGKVQYLALHEAYPGHHLQLSCAAGIEDEMYKRTFSHIFIEGWAFYCEQMMKEMGYFDRDGELAQLQAAYWRALRILLDIGLHTKRFAGVPEAYEFMQDKVNWAPSIAHGELNRYTLMPTQALSYYTGKLELFRIKEAYRKQKGAGFTLREFHNDLLACGSLPPKLIEWKLGLKEITPPREIPQKV